ncbi:acyl-CoA dehydrogenase family protein [Aeromicrobium halocynthiae]|uniref:Acyl-CoA dehydrogenase family protein n=1 Tax=Aeromicrobium halocynthiae TaxID=560557 RepID=A0ABN2VUQ5_9ACTN
MTADLLYSDVEESLRSSVRDLLAARLSSHDVARSYDEAVDFRPLWRSLSSGLGLSGLLVPEVLGGAGATAREAAVVLEELGRSVAPVPFLTSSVVATTCLLAAGEEATVSRMAAGEVVTVLALPLDSDSSSWSSEVVARDGVLRGSVRNVADAGWADHLLLPAVGPDGELSLFLVEARDVRVDSVVSLDMSRAVADIAIDGAPGRPIVSGRDAIAAVDRALDAGAALLASEQLGVARWCFETTTAYLKERRQFGRLIGSYQAVKHRMADVFLEVGHMAAVARYAADCLATSSDDLPVAIAVAEAYCSDVAVHVAEEAVQLHGGLGMTWEHPAHLYLKRAKADQIAFGVPGRHRARLAELVDLPA